MDQIKYVQHRVEADQDIADQLLQIEERHCDVENAKKTHEARKCNFLLKNENFIARRASLLALA